MGSWRLWCFLSYHASSLLWQSLSPMVTKVISASLPDHAWLNKRVQVSLCSVLSFIILIKSHFRFNVRVTQALAVGYAAGRHRPGRTTGYGGIASLRQCFPKAIWVSVPNARNVIDNVTIFIRVEKINILLSTLNLPEINSSFAP